MIIGIFGKFGRRKCHIIEIQIIAILGKNPWSINLAEERKPHLDLRINVCFKKTAENQPFDVLAPSNQLFIKVPCNPNNLMILIAISISFLNKTYTFCKKADGIK